MLTRRAFLASLGALAACRGAPLAPRANVLIVTFCSMRADRMGWLGYGRRPTTPHLDTLAATAFRFRRAWANATWTNASHASILTGLFPGHHHVLDDADVLAEVPTLPGVLRDAGYRRAALIDEHTTMSVPERSQILRDVEQVWRLADLRTFDPAVVADWVRADTTPWFALVHLREAHLPFGDGSPFVPPDTLHPDLRAWRAGLPRPGSGDVKVWSHPDDPLTWLAAQKTIDRTVDAALDLAYDSGVHAADAAFGALIAALGSALDNTIILAVADHGEALVGHKDVLDRAVAQVPLLLKLPVANAGRDVRADVSHVDLMPTVLDVLGLDAPKADGQSLVPCFTAEPPARAAFTQSATRSPFGTIQRREAIVRDGWRLQQLDDERFRVEQETNGRIVVHTEAGPEATALHDELVRLGEDSWMPPPGEPTLNDEQRQQMRQQGYF